MTTIPAQVLEQHIAVLGKTGSGKTSTAKLAIEQVVGQGARVCVLDPIKSDWWGLTSSASGKRAGLPFHILGGPHGHVPMHESAGKVVAEIVGSGALPLSIIDMADFEPGGQAKFFVDFAPTLLRKMRGVVYLVIEEAHLFAPKERSGVGKENLSIHWAKTLATAGRSKGIRLVLVSQRTQALHNALLGSCDTMIAHRLTAPADQDPILKWLKANTSKDVLEQVAASLSSLKTGDAWLCSGEAKIFERVHFPRIKTYDNTATPTGTGDTRVIKTAPVDQKKLRDIIGAAVEQAQADDPTELRKEIRSLKERATKAEFDAAEWKALANIPSPKKVVEKVVTVKVDKQLNAIEGYVNGANAFVEAMRKHSEKQLDTWNTIVVPSLRKIGDEIRNAFEKARPSLAPPSASTTAPTTAIRTTPKAAPIATAGGSIAGGMRDILQALAQHGALNPSKLRVVARLKKRSTLKEYTRRLSRDGYITYHDDSWVITSAGRDKAGPIAPLPTGKALEEWWQQEVGDKGMGQIFRLLLAQKHRWHSLESISDACSGLNVSSIREYTRRLAALGLAQKDKSGGVKIAQDFED